MTNEVLKQTIRDAGGIVHSDGNIFFTNADQFQRAALAAASAVPSHREKVYESLLKACVGQLKAWHAKYGANGPSWLPPGGNVTLMETIDDWLATSAVDPQPSGTAMQATEKYEFDDPDLELLTLCRKGIEYEDNGDPIRDVMNESDFIAAIRLLLSVAELHGITKD